MKILKQAGEPLRYLRLILIALMLALLITPAATAQFLTERLHQMMIVSALIGMVSGVVGIYLSWYLATGTGATIVLTMTVLFIVVCVVKTQIIDRV